MLYVLVVEEGKLTPLDQLLQVMDILHGLIIIVLVVNIRFMLLVEAVVDGIKTQIKVVAVAVELCLVQHKVYLDHLVVMEQIVHMVQVVEELVDGLLVVQQHRVEMEVREHLLTGMVDQVVEQDLDLVLVEVLLLEIILQMVVNYIQLEVVV
jgi:hypothetical protein